MTAAGEEEEEAKALTPSAPPMNPTPEFAGTDEFGCDGGGAAAEGDEGDPERDWSGRRVATQ